MRPIRAVSPAAACSPALSSFYHRYHYHRHQHYRRHIAAVTGCHHPSGLATFPSLTRFPISPSLSLPFSPSPSTSFIARYLAVSFKSINFFRSSLSLLSPSFFHSHIRALFLTNILALYPNAALTLFSFFFLIPFILSVSPNYS